MTLQKKHYIWGGVILLAVLIFFSWRSYQTQANTRKALQAQARQIQGLQGQDTVTAKDLLDKMTESMNKTSKITFEV